jgi:hypothetical protein
VDAVIDEQTPPGFNLISNGRAGNRDSIVHEPVKPRGNARELPRRYCAHSGLVLTAIPAKIIIIKKIGLCKPIDAH